MSESKKEGPVVRLLTGPQTAEILGLSLRTVRALVQRGELRVVRIGRSVRFDPADLQQLIDLRKRRIDDLRNAAERQGKHLTTATELAVNQAKSNQSPKGGCK